MDLSYAAPMELIAGSTYGAWMVSPTAIDGVSKNAKYFDKGIDAGTGPYTVDSYTPDQEVDFKSYPAYWGGWDGAHVSDVVAKIVPEAASSSRCSTEATWISPRACRPRASPGTPQTRTSS